MSAQTVFRRRSTQTASGTGAVGLRPVYTVCCFCRDEIPDRGHEFVLNNKNISVEHWPSQCQCKYAGGIGGTMGHIIRVPASKNPLSADSLCTAMRMLPPHLQCGSGQYRVFREGDVSVVKCVRVNREGVFVYSYIP